MLWATSIQKNIDRFKYSTSVLNIIRVANIRLHMKKQNVEEQRVCKHQRCPNFMVAEYWFLHGKIPDKSIVLIVYRSRGLCMSVCVWNGTFWNGKRDAHFSSEFDKWNGPSVLDMQMPIRTQIDAEYRFSVICRLTVHRIELHFIWLSIWILSAMLYGEFTYNGYFFVFEEIQTNMYIIWTSTKWPGQLPMLIVDARPLYIDFFSWKYQFQ